MGLNFRMLLLWYHYIIDYAVLQGLWFCKEAILYWFMILCLIHAPSKKEEESRNRIGGLVRSTFQKVHRIHELEFSYASFMLSLCYRLCAFYKDYALTKKSPKKLCFTLILWLYVYSCSDAVMVHSIYYDFMRKHCHLTTIILHRRMFSKELLLCWFSAIIWIWYSNFMTSKGAYHSSFQTWQQHLNILK